jgi:hypothetical protein
MYGETKNSSRRESSVRVSVRFTNRDRENDNSRNEERFRE